jgi:hypothetical protein
VRLFFINEDEAFTDGRNIVVDPGFGGMFADKSALERTEDCMGLRHNISQDAWYALRMITRGLNIHECLHILYTNFPLYAAKDPRCTTKAKFKTLAHISNIIEDAFIEVAGCSVFDNLELYLRFLNLATVFCNTPFEGTAERAFKTEQKNVAEPLSLVEYLEYMCVFLIYPTVRQDEPKQSIAAYVGQTKQLFLEGSICANADIRFTYSQRIFDIIEPLIPGSEEFIDDSRLNKILPGAKTHNGDNASIANIISKGKDATITRRLFTDLDGALLPNKDFSEQLYVLVADFEGDKVLALDIILLKPCSNTLPAAKSILYAIQPPGGSFSP